MPSRRFCALALAALLTPAPAFSAEYSCADCDSWNAPHAPFRIHGNTWYVGTQGLSALLVTSDRGHVLIDGGLPQSAPRIAASIAALGFRLGDVKLILNSHAHFDHAGGIAELARLSGATVAASPYSAGQLRNGNPDDAQFGRSAPYPALATVREIADGEVLRVGDLAMTAHFTPGHTTGGTSWTWRSCEGARCLNMVYADSLTAPGFRLLGNPRQPEAVAQFRGSFARVAALPCDILVSPHPDFSDLFEHLAAREAGQAEAFIDAGACRRYAAAARARFEAQLAREQAAPPAPAEASGKRP